MSLPNERCRCMRVRGASFDTLLGDGSAGRSCNGAAGKHSAQLPKQAVRRARGLHSPAAGHKQPALQHALAAHPHRSQAARCKALQHTSNSSSTGASQKTSSVPSVAHTMMAKMPVARQSSPHRCHCA